MLLFVAHDPGARNHISPIYIHAKTVGEMVEYVDLSTGILDEDAATELIRRLQPDLLITGCSTNRSEWPIIRVAKKSGINVAVVVDITATGKLNHVPPSDFPDRFMVTNSFCRKELTDFGASPESITVTGSAYIESLSNSKSQTANINFCRLYGFSEQANLISFFGSTNTEASIEAVVSLTTLLPETSLNHPVVIVRPHPRAANKKALETACGKLNNFFYDAGDQVESHELLAASRFSLTMVSTVSLESLVLGIPSAFYLIGWDVGEFRVMMRNFDQVLRIRDLEELKVFVATATNKRETLIPDNIENHRGALGRMLDVIGDLRSQ